MALRLQGTDGIRRQVALSDDPLVLGLTPQEAFLEKDVITEQFFELYCYCRVRQLIENKVMVEGGSVVIGWDSRDKEGIFTDASITGLQKAGASVHVIGVAPTPLVPLFARYVFAAGGFMITASHNPSTYNGVKIFTRHGLKLLPGDDIALSEIVLELDYDTIKDISKEGDVSDQRNDSSILFKRLMLESKNSLIDDSTDLSKVTLICDTANGALGNFAGEILNDTGFEEVIAVNDDGDAGININSGVADLEGLREIVPSEIEDGGRFSKYIALTTLLNVGRKNRDKAKAGDATISAAIFDGDGDRFYRADYDPYDDNVKILSGDEIAILQAKQFLGKFETESPLFVNTVESDLAVVNAAESAGYECELTGVGDKWILLTAFMSQFESTLDKDIFIQLGVIAYSETPSADEIEKILRGARYEMPSTLSGPFLIGVEETGHAITPLFTECGIVFAGNGLKSCLNTYAATERKNSLKDKEAFSNIVEPFPPGFKSTLYAYYIEKERWRRDSETWGGIMEIVKSSIAKVMPTMDIEEMIRPEDSDMLYLQIVDEENPDIRGAIFIRNSGTEDKIGVNLRGDNSIAEPLAKVGEETIKSILLKMKDGAKPQFSSELTLLRLAKDGGAPEDGVDEISGDAYHHLLMEVGSKQGFLDAPSPGAKLTNRGQWYLKTITG